MNCRQANEIGIPTLLAAVGMRPLRSDASGLFFRSPWSMSGDQNPSLQVSPDGRKFHDWSSNRFGDIVDMAKLLIGNQSVPAALKFIESVIGSGYSLMVNDSERKPAVKRKNTPSIIIDNITAIQSKLLMGYAWGRGIHRNILTEYCKEVYYHLAERPDKPYYAIGWPNDSGGYELRNAYVKQAVAPKDITTIGDLVDCPVVVCEGFFDFLSMVVLNIYDPHKMTAIILNSTALLPKAITALHSYSPTRVICMFDHDTAGREATQRMLAEFPLLAMDSSSFYRQYNDINDYLRIKKGMNDSYNTNKRRDRNAC